MHFPWQGPGPSPGTPPSGPAWQCHRLGPGVPSAGRGQSNYRWVTRSGLSLVPRGFSGEGARGVKRQSCLGQLLLLLEEKGSGSWDPWPPSPTSLPEASSSVPTFQGWVLPGGSGMSSPILEGIDLLSPGADSNLERGPSCHQPCVPLKGGGPRARPQKAHGTSALSLTTLASAVSSVKCDHSACPYRHDSFFCED